MANFLALCQRVRQECGVAGTGPATVLSQTGMYAKIVNWTARSWVDIQASKPYWKFLRAQMSKTMVIGQRTYNVSSDWSLTSVDKWDPEGAYIYKTTVADQAQLTWKPYSEFRAMYSNGFETGRPTVITEAQGNTIAFNRTPDYAYVLTFDYWMTPELLAANTDVPAAPEHFHDIIVWGAVLMFAGTEGAPELAAYAQRMYSKAYLQLMIDQMETPPKVKNFPLATGRTSWRGTDTWGS